jgi:hypothetical protein
MRESNRDKILDGVVRLIERDGVTAVTFDAVAAETSHRAMNCFWQPTSIWPGTGRNNCVALPRTRTCRLTVMQPMSKVAVGMPPGQNC